MAPPRKRQKRIISDAIKDAEVKKKEALVEAKDEIHKQRNEVEKEVKERRNEVQRLESTYPAEGRIHRPQDG